MIFSLLNLLRSLLWMNPIVEFVRSTQALEEIRENIRIARFFNSGHLSPPSVSSVVMHGNIYVEVLLFCFGHPGKRNRIQLCLPHRGYSAWSRVCNWRRSRWRQVCLRYGGVPIRPVRGFSGIYDLSRLGATIEMLLHISILLGIDHHVPTVHAVSWDLSMMSGSLLK